MNQTKNAFLLITLLFMSACGYHLRGAIELPKGLKSIYMQGGSDELRGIVKKTLRSFNGRFVNVLSDAGVGVQVIREKMDRRVLSLNETGRVNEFEVIYTLDFVLLNPNGQAMSEKQSIEINRDYFNDQQDVLGRSNEEDVIKDEIYLQVVVELVSRIRATLKEKSQDQEATSKIE